MANNYRVKGNVGQWTDGQIITDDDLKAAPGMGGVARLRDQLRVIEDTTDEPAGNPNDPNSPARLPENTTGSTSRRAATDPFAARAAAAAGPNAGAAGPQAKGPAQATAEINARTGGTPVEAADAAADAEKGGTKAAHKPHGSKS